MPSYWATTDKVPISPSTCMAVWAEVDHVTRKREQQRIEAREMREKESERPLVEGMLLSFDVGCGYEATRPTAPILEVETDYCRGI